LRLVSNCWRLFFGSAVLFLLLTGCEVEGVPGCAPGEGSSLEIGTGHSAFVPLAGNAPELELVYGPQGGFHTDMALRARFLDPAEEWEGRFVGTLDGEMWAESQGQFDMRCNPEFDALDLWAVRLVWDALPDELHDQLVAISVEVIDSAGVSASTRVEGVRIVDPHVDPDDSPGDSRSVATGP